MVEHNRKGGLLEMTSIPCLEGYHYSSGILGFLSIWQGAIKLLFVGVLFLEINQYAFYIIIVIYSSEVTLTERHFGTN